MTTTTKLGDSLGRALVNDNPGTSNATDYLGRAVTASNKDFRGVALVDNPLFPPADRANNTAYTLGQRVKVKGIDEVETLTVTATGGNFKLAVTCRGSTETTPNIAVSGLSASVLNAAVVALPNVEPGDIVFSGGSSPYTITVQSEQGNVTQIAVVAGSPDVTGGTVVTGTTTQGAAGGQIYECTTAGTSGGSVPSLPAVGASVTDGTAHWKRLK